MDAGQAYMQTAGRVEGPPAGEPAGTPADERAQEDAALLRDLAARQEEAVRTVEGFGSDSALDLEWAASADGVSVGAVESGAALIIPPALVSPLPPPPPAALADLNPPTDVDEPPPGMPPEQHAAWRSWRRQVAGWRRAQHAAGESGQIRHWVESAADRIAAHGAEVELVVAAGLLTVTTEPRLSRHLLVAPAAVTASADGTLVVAGGPAMLDEDLLEAGMLGDGLRSALAPLRAEVDAGRFAAADLPAAGEQLGWAFAEVEQHLPPHAQLSYAPMLLCRRRRRHRTVAALQALATTPTRPHPLAPASERRVGTAAGPLVLPSPATPAQQRIITAAAEGGDVAVSGPAGTGKSHTIANLAAALAADGRRVLVAADEFPVLEQVRRLAGEPIAAVAPIEDPVGGGDLAGPLRAAAALADQGDAEQEARQARAELDAAAAAHGQALDELAALRGPLSSERSLLGVRMTAAGHWAALAALDGRERVVEQFDPHMPVREDMEPPLSDDEMARLLHHTEELADLDGPIVVPEVPTVAEAAALLADRAQAHMQAYAPTGEGGVDEGLRRTVAALDPAVRHQLELAAERFAADPEAQAALTAQRRSDVLRAAAAAGLPLRLARPLRTLTAALADEYADSEPRAALAALRNRTEQAVGRLHEVDSGLRRRIVGQAGADTVRLQALADHLDRLAASATDVVAERCLAGLLAGEHAGWQARRDALAGFLADAPTLPTLPGRRTAEVWAQVAAVADAVGQAGPWRRTRLLRRHEELLAGVEVAGVEVEADPQRVADAARAAARFVGLLGGWGRELLDTADPLAASGLLLESIDGLRAAVAEVADEPLVDLIPSRDAAGCRRMAVACRALVDTATQTAVSASVAVADWEPLLDELAAAGANLTTVSQLRRLTAALAARSALRAELGAPTADAAVDYAAATEYLDGIPDPAQVLAAVARSDATANLEVAQGRLAAIQERLAAAPAPGPALAAALASGDLAAYEQASNDLARLQARAERMADRQALSDRLATTNPGLAKAIAENPRDERLAAWLPDEFGRLWRAAGRRRLLIGWEPPDEGAATDRLTAEEARLEAAESRWVAAEVRRRAADAYGGQRGDLLADLEGSLDVAVPPLRAAAPLWFATVEAVAGMVASGRIDLFDTVLVDEAASAPATAALVYAAGRNTAVFGDADMSVEPEGGSLLSFAVQRVGGSVRRLQEHFRSSPELLSVAASTADGPTAERITPIRPPSVGGPPPFRRVQVAGGHGSGGQLVAEADRVVDEVAALHADGRWRDASFAVASLAAPAWYLDHIRRGLQARIGADERAVRRLVVGQVSELRRLERDVVVCGVGALPDGEPAVSSAQIGLLLSRVRGEFVLVHLGAPQVWPDGQPVRRLIDTIDAPPAWSSPLSPALNGQVFELLVDGLRERGFDPHPGVPLLEGQARLAFPDGRGGMVGLAVSGLSPQGDAGSLADERAREQILERLGWRFLRVPAIRLQLNPEHALDALARQVARADGGTGTAPLA